MLSQDSERPFLIALRERELSVSPVAARVREPDARLLAILLSDAEMTEEEAAYVAACERAAA